MVSIVSYRKQICVLVVTSCLVVHGFPDKPKFYSTDDVIVDGSEERRPYSFAYTASRYFKGVPDREHTEERDVHGITRGVFRYVDPYQEVQEVVYTSDKGGFHVDRASNTPRDTPVVEAAKNRHHILFSKIREEHQEIADKLDELNKKSDKEKQSDEKQEATGQSLMQEFKREDIAFEIKLKSPADSPAVNDAKKRHFRLYDKIKQEHIDKRKELEELHEDHEEKIYK